MYYLSTSCLVLLFFFFSLFGPLPCSSSKEELEWCEEALFKCGNITAGFPFWGGDRLQACGHPLLELHCIQNITSLFISNQEYYIFHLNQSSTTLRFVKKNILDSICTSPFTNKTLPPEIFQLSKGYKSLTVFYHCFPSRHADSRYTCPGLGPITESEYTERCHDSLPVKVPKSSIPEEKQLNLTHLESALREAFEVKVKINVKACQECPSSYGFCGFNISSPFEVICRTFRQPTGLSMFGAQLEILELIGAIWSKAEVCVAEYLI